MMPTVTYNFREGYRYQFQGQEVDNEVSGTGNHVVFSERGLDTRLGRMNWKIDPLYAKYPMVSSYAFADNSPIVLVDVDGREITIYYTDQTTGKEVPAIFKPGDEAPSGADQFVKDVYSSLNHLYQEAGANAQGLIQRLVDADQNIVVEKGKVNSTSGNKNEAFVIFNTQEGLKTNTPNPITGNDIQSPALGLLHELDHAEKYFELYDKVLSAKATGDSKLIKEAQNNLDDFFKDIKLAEENRVTEGSETKAALMLGQGIRKADGDKTAYDGWLKVVKTISPTSTVTKKELRHGVKGKEKELGRKLTDDELKVVIKDLETKKSSSKASNKNTPKQ